MILQVFIFETIEWWIIGAANIKMKCGGWINDVMNITALYDCNYHKHENNTAQH